MNGAQRSFVIPTSYIRADCQEIEKRPIEVCGIPGLKIETWGTQSFMDGQMWDTSPIMYTLRPCPKTLRPCSTTRSSR